MKICLVLLLSHPPQILFGKLYLKLRRRFFFCPYYFKVNILLIYLLLLFDRRRVGFEETKGRIGWIRIDGRPAAGFRFTLMLDNPRKSTHFSKLIKKKEKRKITYYS